MSDIFSRLLVKHPHQSPTTPTKAKEVFRVKLPGRKQITNLKAGGLRIKNLIHALTGKEIFFHQGYTLQLPLAA
jgi:hypothetical protein